MAIKSLVKKTYFKARNDYIDLFNKKTAFPKSCKGKIYSQEGTKIQTNLIT